MTVLYGNEVVRAEPVSRGPLAAGAWSHNSSKKSAPPTPSSRRWTDSLADPQSRVDKELEEEAPIVVQQAGQRPTRISPQLELFEGLPQVGRVPTMSQ